MGKRELVALLCLSSWCLVIVVWLFLTVPGACLQFVVVVFLIILTYYFVFHARLFIDALWSPAVKGLTSWLSLVMSNCEVVTFPLLSWIRCGA